MAPLSGADGLPDGPYLEHLQHLNIRGTAFTSLPQVRCVLWCAVFQGELPALFVCRCCRRVGQAAGPACGDVEWHACPPVALPLVNICSPARLLQHLTRAQQLTFLGLSCCHDLWMCG